LHGVWITRSGLDVRAWFHLVSGLSRTR
jgi:hypothetical protein